MRQPHILFVEDDPDTRELMQFVLGSAGFSVSVTGDVSEALRFATNARFDALLLDNWLPGVTGIELCRQIRSFDHSTPIFFCSGAATDADKKAALSAGAQGYFTKPFNTDDLIAALRLALKIPEA